MDDGGLARGRDVVASTVAWYQEHARDLPWRAVETAGGPWGVLVCEVMAQQTPVARVLPRWHAWMDRWPTPADLATASTADVLRAWESLGYPRRALRLQECARVVVERHDGEVPQTYAELLALPGVGDYTASAVVAFAYGRRAVVLDTNVRRVIARAITGTAQAPPSLTKSERALAERLAPANDEHAAAWAAASMELGALVCTARSTACEACPVLDLCAWRVAGYPPDEHAGRRRTQAWAGTDRQVRGRVLDVLRRSPTGTAARAEVVAQVLAAVPTADDAQVERCVGGLAADGLVVEPEHGVVALPA